MATGVDDIAAAGGGIVAGAQDRDGVPVLMAGIVLLTIIYMLAAKALDDGVPSLGISGTDSRVSSDRCPPLSSAASLQEIDVALNGCFEHQRAAALDTLLLRAPRLAGAGVRHSLLSHGGTGNDLNGLSSPSLKAHQ